MNPAGNLNALQQYLDWYHKNVPDHQTGPLATSGFDMAWAQKMLDQDQRQQTMGNQNFFGGQSGQGGQASQGGQGGYQPSAYVPPQQSQGRFQMPPSTPQPLTGQVNNVLAQMLNRR